MLITGILFVVDFKVPKLKGKGLIALWCSSCCRTCANSLFFMIKDRQGHIVKELEGQNKLLKKLYSTSAGRCALKILVSPFVTHLGGLYMSSPFSKTSISSFIKNNDIDMSQYEEKKYKSYNDFFTRRIKDGQRPFDDSKDVLMAPADSKLILLSNK